MSATTTVPAPVGSKKAAARGPSGGVLNKRRGKVATVIMLVLALIWLFPLIWALYNSFRDYSYTQTNGYLSFGGWTFDNYTNAWSRGQFGLHLWNSLLITIPAVLLTLFFSSLIAFVLARFSYRFNLTLLGIFLAANLLPPQALLIPVFRMFREIPLPTFMSEGGTMLNSFWALILVNTAFQMGFCTFVLSNYMKTLPYEIYESAEMDGASVWRQYWQLTMPLVPPGPRGPRHPPGDVDLQRVLLGHRADVQGREVPGHQCAEQPARAVLPGHQPGRRGVDHRGAPRAHRVLRAAEAVRVRADPRVDQGMSDTLHVVRGGGTALVLAPVDDGLPSVLHWGPDLPDAAAADLRLTTGTPVPHNALDAPWPLTVLPTSGTGWLGTPAYEAHRAGSRTAPRWVATTRSGDGSLEVRATASDVGVQLVLRYRLDEHGVLVVESSLTNTSDDPAPLDLGALRAVLPLPARADEVLDLTGRWCRERSPQRRPVADGTWLRTGRRGRTGHDATLLMVAGTAGFGFRRGEVWAAHVAWSGNHEHLVERLPEGAGPHAAVLGGGEPWRRARCGWHPARPTPRRPSCSCTPPRGSTGSPARSHGTSAPSRATRATPRPLVLNTWEAVYFDHDLDQLQRAGRHRRRSGSSGSCSTTAGSAAAATTPAGLGDWQVVAGGLARRASARSSTTSTGLGMEFGLWFEPEMVNLDSDLVRAHPRVGARPARPACRCRRARSTCSTSPTPRPSRTCSRR